MNTLLWVGIPLGLYCALILFALYRTREVPVPVGQDWGVVPAEHEPPGRAELEAFVKVKSEAYFQVILDPAATESQVDHAWQEYLAACDQLEAHGSSSQEA